VPLLATVLIIYSKSLFAKVLDKKLTEKANEAEASHRHGNRLRKQFTQNVQDILSDLAKETDANRAIVFEFSNGTTNLVGLPFLFMTVAAEVTTPGLALMGPRHQKLNTSIISSFLIKLEREGYLLIDDSLPMIEEYKILSQLMEKANINSALFCSIQGIEEAIGFLVIITSKTSGNKFDLRTDLISTSKAAQKIGSMINFDEIDIIEKDKHKFK
jgi:hypothetical protein